VNEVQSTIEKVQKSKDERCKELDSFVESIQAKLSSQLKTKLLTLMGQKTAMTGEIEQLEAFQRVLNQELFQQPKSKLIKKSADLVRQLREIH
jgi:tripartite motif-containing protein 37